MIAKILPPADYARLNGTELETVWPNLNPHTAQVVVVEDDDGAILGCWAGFPLWHSEGVYIAPDHRGKAGVARMLLDMMKHVALENGYRSIVTASQDPTVDRLLEHLDATRLPGTHYVFPVAEREA